MIKLLKSTDSKMEFSYTLNSKIKMGNGQRNIKNPQVNKI